MKAKLTEVKDELSVKDLVLIFGVTHKTVSNWRAGSARIYPLPYRTRKCKVRSRVYFLREEVKKWAYDHGIGIKKRF